MTFDHALTFSYKCPILGQIQKTANKPFDCYVKPVVYPIDHHKIATHKLDPQAFYVIEKLKQAGHDAYLVGGGVRDLLLNLTPKDFDISTSAKPEEIRSLFRNSILIGRRFRLAHIRFGKKIIEVATFRSGDTETSDLIVRDNQWGSEEQDVLRRDFTINGLFYDPQNEVVIDYVGGYPDLEKKILKTIGDPETRFSQDPVRMIRLLKFSARFHFEIEKPTLEALLNCKGSITQSSSVRILEELLKMLESGASARFFHLLYQYGLLFPLLPELAHFWDRHGEHFTLGLLEQADTEIQQTGHCTIDRAVLLACLVFPLTDAYLQQLLKQEKKIPHLGQIASSVLHVIDCLFNPFFHLPKRLKSIVAFILISQYRFVPLDQRANKRPRLPNDPFTPLALHLLKIRATQDSSLLPAYTLWAEAAFSSHEPGLPADLPKKKYRGRRET